MTLLLASAFKRRCGEAKVFGTHKGAAPSEVGMWNRVNSLSLLGMLLLASALRAQGPDSGVIHLTVHEEMGPVEDAVVRVAGQVRRTDAAGRVRLVLPAGRHTLVVGRIGYHEKRIPLLVAAGLESPFMVEMVMGDMEMVELEDISVSATRTERLSGETPIRVEVISEMEVDEKTQMAPSGISMLLNESPGVRVQAASPSLGTGSVRILGLPGQYTTMLADGLPLYGGAASALGPLDISPVDLQRVEILKGAASALYGGQALGGVVNLVSKPPTGRNELLLNRRTLDVTDGAAWLSRRFSGSTGASLLVSGTMQGAEDIDGDGWGDQPDARRWNIRPRLSRVDSSGRSFFVTAGYGYDDRQGGTLAGAVAPDSSMFREGLTGRRADLGIGVRLPTGPSGNVAVRFALSTNSRERRWGNAEVEEDRISTGFLEVTRGGASPRSATVIGVVLQKDRYVNALNSAHDHDWFTPGVFATGERDIGPVTWSASMRGDFHPEAGSRLSGRVAGLIRPIERWSLRASVGTGFAPPGAMNEETEAIGLRAVRPGIDLKPERSIGTSVDLNGVIAGMEFLITGYRAVIDDAVGLADAGDASGDGILVNAAGPSRSGGVEVAGIIRFTGGKVYLTYGYAQGSRAEVDGAGRETIPLVPRHRLGADLMLERPGVYRIGLEGTWYGTQELMDDPYRARSKPYFYTMFLVMRRFGATEVVANFENLLNIRQTDYAPLVRPTPTVGGRWTTDAWAPLEGFMANVAVRYRW